MWFLESRSIDHATICAFRERFNDLLPALFDQLSRQAGAAAGEAAGRHAAVDGTRTAKKLRERLEEVARDKQRLLQEIGRHDALDTMYEAVADANGADAAELRGRIERYDAERAKLERALEAANERDAHKQANDGPSATAVRVPVTDPEAHALPHKEGGFGYIKYVMGVRQFFYRGAAAVTGEWRWICAGFNVMKILRRAQKAIGPAGVGDRHRRQARAGAFGCAFWSRAVVLGGLMRI